MVRRAPSLGWGFSFSAHLILEEKICLTPTNPSQNLPYTCPLNALNHLDEELLKMQRIEYEDR